MKINCSSQRNRALTLVEVLVVLFVLFILVAMLLPTSNAYRKARQISCVNNLKQIGLAYRLWEGDNNDKYPMDISITNGGTMELSAAENDVRDIFMVMSNELLSTPKILICPADTDHVAATNFSTDFSAKNISYFAGLDADTNHLQAMLAGDDNFEIGGVPVKSGRLEFSTNAPIAWTTARHNKQGDIGLADGSVQETTSGSLREWLLPQTGLATNRILIP